MREKLENKEEKLQVRVCVFRRKYHERCNIVALDFLAMNLAKA